MQVKKGNKCKYTHDWKDIPKQPRRSKGLVCGSVAHRAKDCKAPGAATSTQAAANPKEGAPGRVTIDPMPQPVFERVPPSLLSSEASSSTSGYEMKQLMLETLQELRRLKSLSVKSEAILAAADIGVRRGLLDSGATHPLRPATVGELQRAEKVKVTLAGDAQQEMNQDRSGTIQRLEFGEACFEVL